MLRHLRFTMKLFLAFMAILAIAAALFIWRVSNGPVLLDGSSSYLRNILTQQGGDENVKFEQSILTWRGADDNPTGRSSFEIKFNNISIINPETSLELTIPSVGMQFSITAFLRGIVAPTFVEIKGLELHLVIPKEVWAEDNSDQENFFVAIKAYLDRFNGSQNLVPRLARQILTKPNPMQSTGYLQQLTLVDTLIKVTDQLSGEKWDIPNTFLDFKRIEEGLSLLLEGAIDIENKEDIPLHMSVQYNMEQEKATTQLRFSNFIPKNIAADVEGLSGLANLNIPISGILDFSIDNELQLPVFDFEFDIDQGIINPGQIYETPIKIDEAGISGQYIAAEDTLSIENFHLQFDGALLNAEGMIYNMQDDPEIYITADLANMPMTNIKTYWPPGFVPNGRIWIERNITGGMISDGKLEMAIDKEMWALERLPNDIFKFDFNITDASSHFLQPLPKADDFVETERTIFIDSLPIMPQLTDVNGRATLNLNHFILYVDTGMVENVEIKDAILHFNDISIKGGAVADFEIPLIGKVEQLLNVLNNRPFGYPTIFGIKENSVTGLAQAQLTLDFPLIKSIKLQDINFNVSADIEDLTIEKLSDNLSLTEGIINLTVTPQGINANGNILLNGVGFNANWLEDFDKNNQQSTIYILDGIVENGQWENLNLPFEPYVFGPVEVHLNLKGKGSKLSVGNGRIELKNAKIKFEPLGWQKEIDEEAGALFNLKIQQNGAFEVNDIAFLSDKLNSDLQLNFDGEMVSRLYIKDLKMENMDFSTVIDWDNDGSFYQVSMRADQFNAVPIMDIVLSMDDDVAVDLPDYNFTGSVKNMFMYNDIIMTDATVQAKYTDNDIIDFNYEGNWGDDKNLSILIVGPDQQQQERQKFTLQTNDAGVGLRSLDFFNGGDQGQLFIKADMEKKEEGIFLTGTIKAADFRVGNSTLFSELLKAKEFAKAQQELERNGLSFDSFDSRFEQYNGVMTLKSGSAKGPTIGVTLDGFVDQKFDEVALSGTIIPAYGINSLFSNIPILGTIIAGAKGEGIFAATYEMRGPIEDPEVNINPLMALAPGIFRKIFGALAGGGKISAREKAAELEENEEEHIRSLELSNPDQ